MVKWSYVSWDYSAKYIGKTEHTKKEGELGDFEHKHTKLPGNQSMQKIYAEWGICCFKNQRRRGKLGKPLKGLRCPWPLSSVWI